MIKKILRNYSKTTIVISSLIIIILIVLNIYLYSKIATTIVRFIYSDLTIVYPHPRFEEGVVYVKIKDSVKMAKLLDSLGFKQKLTTDHGTAKVKTKKSYEEMEQIRDKIKAKNPENFWPWSLITQNTQSISISSRKEISVLEMKEFIDSFEELEVKEIHLAQSNYGKSGSIGVKIYVKKGSEIIWMNYFKNFHPDIIEDALLNYYMDYDYMVPD